MVRWNDSYKHFPPCVSFSPLQSLSHVQRVLLSWATTMALCLRRTRALPAWNGQSFPIMCSSIPAEVWGSTATAETLTVSPTPGASSDRAPGPLAGLTVTAIRVRPSVFLFCSNRNRATLFHFLYSFHVKQNSDCVIPCEWRELIFCWEAYYLWNTKRALTFEGVLFSKSVSRDANRVNLMWQFSVY